MEKAASSSISSFVIRFVVNNEPAESGQALPYRGEIRHIQTQEQIHFTRWEDAVAFIQRYVPIPPTKPFSDGENT